MKTAVLAILMAFSAGTVSYAADAAAGEQLFLKKCKGCHAFGRKKMGPDLEGISQRADKEWLTNWLTDTKATWNSDSPITANLKERVGSHKNPKHKTPKLSDTDIADIVEFLSTK